LERTSRTLESSKLIVKAFLVIAVLNDGLDGRLSRSDSAVAVATAATQTFVNVRGMAVTEQNASLPAGLPRVLIGLLEAAARTYPSVS